MVCLVWMSVRQRGMWGTIFNQKERLEHSVGFKFVRHHSIEVSRQYLSFLWEFVAKKILF